MKCRFQVRNMNKVETFMNNLPKKLDKELTKTNLRFMELVQSTTKRLVPTDTGSLKEDIRLLPVRRGKNIKKWKLVVDSPYALFQEEGFKPHSFFASNINSSKLAPGKRYFVSKFTPFLKPAVRRSLKTFSKKLNNAVGRAIKWN